VALYAQREIHRLPPDKHEFINKMALYAAQGYEPSQKQGKYLFFNTSEGGSHNAASSA
jgi:hypothetical protein